MNMLKMHSKIFPEITKEITEEITEEIAQEYTLKFGGCSKDTPGLSGAGAVIYCNNKEIYGFSKCVGDNITNNQAEYHGLILGLQNAITQKVELINVYGDSELIIKQMRGEYIVNPPLLFLYQEAKNLEKNFVSIKYHHIYKLDNTRAYDLANL